jgi:hypothetical protein
LDDREERLDYDSAEGVLALVVVLALIVAIVVLFLLFKYNYFGSGVTNLKQR